MVKRPVIVQLVEEGAEGLQRPQAEVKEAFEIFGKEGDASTIPSSDLGTVLRSLGQTPTQAEVQAWVQEFDAGGGGTIDFSDFCTCMSRVMKGAASEADLVDAFRVFDKDNSGFISSAEVRLVMTNLGEGLPEDEIDEIIREIDPSGDGKVEYASFVKTMMAP